MKPVVNCKLAEVGVLPRVGTPAYVLRTSEHPKLGQPNSRITQTSKVLRVDTENCIIETLNTLYLYK